MTTVISGDVAEGYGPIADAFAESFSNDPAMGAALAIRIDGLCVVNLWGGIADPRTNKPWQRETTAVLFSGTKGLVAILAARLAQDQRLEFDTPVTTYWPEFGQAGKSSITVRQLLSHQAGLSAPREDLTLDDVLSWESVIRCLEEQAPLWTIGDGHAYHALTFGWLVGEVIRRITGMSVGEYFKVLITDPLGVEAWIGLPVSQEHNVAFISSSESRMAQVSAQVSGQSVDTVDWYDRALTLGSAFTTNLITPDGGFNDPRIHAVEIPAGGGIATARALATIWSATVVSTDGVRLLSDETIAETTKVQSEGKPIFAALPPYFRWGTGFELNAPPAREYLTPVSFGHDGSGGQFGFADPKFKMGFAYLTNLLDSKDDDRGSSIIRALRRKLA